MNAMSSRWLAAVVSALFLVSLAPSPEAQAAGRDGGGRAAGGGGARAAGGGGGGGGRAHAGQAGGGAARQAPQATAQRADNRTNQVRSASTNSVNNNRNTNVNANRSNNTNVNANRNVNVNVNGNNNCCGGWDNDYHPVAGAMAVGAAVAVTSAAIGSLTQAVPAGCVPINYGGMVYQQCGSTWYQPQGAQFVVVNPPY